MPNEIKPASSAPIEPHNFTHDGKEVLILRRLNPDRKAHQGFVYPSGIGAIVHCPDFNRQPTCGGGIHGWPWSFGLGEGSDFDVSNDIWMILAAKPENVIGNLDGGWKCKCLDPEIRFEGKFKDAMDQLRAGFTACVQAMCAKSDVSKETACGNVTNKDNATNASSGHSAKNASSGDNATNASSGPSAKNASSGDNATNASSGDNAKNASSGDNATNASSGYNAKNASSGHSAKNASSGPSATNASSGDNAKNASSGDSAKNASSGPSAKNASSGDNATNASSGDNAKNEANGKNSVIACAGNGSKAKVGDRGVFCLTYWDERTGWEMLIGKEGRDGVKAGTWYEVKAGKLVEVA